MVLPALSVGVGVSEISVGKSVEVAVGVDGIPFGSSVEAVDNKAGVAVFSVGEERVDGATAFRMIYPKRKRITIPPPI
jgi:hypothetical protein